LSLSELPQLSVLLQEPGHPAGYVIRKRNHLEGGRYLVMVMGKNKGSDIDVG
jgi:hypothetical protein